jgi:large subunit ribosomal protein L4
MPKLNVLDRKGKKVGTYNVEPTDFAPRINKQLLHDAVVMYQANERQGSHQTKSRGMVAGSTKKMYRQKGTGSARRFERSGIRRGGRHIRQGEPRLRLPAAPARRPRPHGGWPPRLRRRVVIIDELSFAEPKTKDMVAVIKHVGCDGGSLLVTTTGYDAKVYRSFATWWVSIARRARLPTVYCVRGGAGDQGRAGCPGGFSGKGNNGDGTAEASPCERVSQTSTPAERPPESGRAPGPKADQLRRVNQEYRAMPRHIPATSLTSNRIRS